MAFELQRIRASSIACVLVGGLLLCVAFTYSGVMSDGQLRYVSPLTVRYQVGDALAGAGGFLIVYGLLRLYRRKGDYDDFEEPATVEEENRWKKPGPGD